MKANLKSCPCGGDLVLGRAVTTFLVNGRKLKKSVPASICKKCGEAYFNGPSMLEIEKKLQREAATA